MPLLALLLLCAIFIPNLHAYLDPGTGSLLLSSVVAIFASLIYFLKGFFYKVKMGGGSRRNLAFLKSKKSTNTTQSIVIPQNAITIYAEDKRYFSLFKPIIDALELLNYPYTYLTGDKADPMLDFQSAIGHIECIGNDNKAFARLNALEADVCLMTTPQLGVLQLKRSKAVKHYCHILHSLPHIDIYEIFALDYFDSVFVNSPIHTDFIREVEAIRHLKTKQVEIVGCPYLDYLAEKVRALDTHPLAPSAREGECLVSPHAREGESKGDFTTPTILVAPSWGREALLSKYGMKLLKPLLETGYPVIIRPHPQSFMSEKAMLDSIRAQTAHFANLKWDTHIDNIHAFAESSLIIGDFSGVLFDYLALFNKPIITMEFHFNTIGYDLEDTSYKTPWVESALKEISESIAERDFCNIKRIIDSTLIDSTKAQNRAKMKELLWHYEGRGGVQSALKLLEIHKGILEADLGDNLALHRQILAIDNLLNIDSTNLNCDSTPKKSKATKSHTQGQK